MFRVENVDHHTNLWPADRVIIGLGIEASLGGWDDLESDAEVHGRHSFSVAAELEEVWVELRFLGVVLGGRNRDEGLDIPDARRAKHDIRLGVVLDKELAIEAPTHEEVSKGVRLVYFSMVACA